MPGAEEVGPAAIESGFATAAGADWEAAPAGFTGTQAAAGWDGQAEEWGNAAAAPPTAEWGATDAKDSQW